MVVDGDLKSMSSSILAPPQPDLRFCTGNSCKPLPILTVQPKSCLRVGLYEFDTLLDILCQVRDALRAILVSWIFTEDAQNQLTASNSFSSCKETLPTS